MRMVVRFDLVVQGKFINILSAVLTVFVSFMLSICKYIYHSQKGGQLTRTIVVLGGTNS